MNLNIAEKVAVVLAASKGLGKAAARALAAEGCRLAVCARDEQTLGQSVAQLKELGAADVLGQKADVGDYNSLRAFMINVADRWGSIDILVNNAGGPPVAGFEESSDEEWEKWYTITFMSVVRAVRLALPFMKKNHWGRIINITSISVKAPVENLIYSNALRLAVIGLAKTLSQELGSYGITVNNVAPGYHLTEGLERIIRNKVSAGQKRDDVLAAWEKQIPLGKIGRAQDLAGLIAFLASEQAGYISGTTIQVDGGLYKGTL